MFHHSATEPGLLSAQHETELPLVLPWTVTKTPDSVFPVGPEDAAQWSVFDPFPVSVGRHSQFTEEETDELCLLHFRFNVFVWELSSVALEGRSLTLARGVSVCLGISSMRRGTVCLIHRFCSKRIRRNKKLNCSNNNNCLLQSSRSSRSGWVRSNITSVSLSKCNIIIWVWSWIICASVSDLWSVWLMCRQSCCQANVKLCFYCSYSNRQTAVCLWPVRPWSLLSITGTLCQTFLIFSRERMSVFVKI